MLQRSPGWQMEQLTISQMMMIVTQFSEPSTGVYCHYEIIIYPVLCPHVEISALIFVSCFLAHNVHVLLGFTLYVKSLRCNSCRNRKRIGHWRIKQIVLKVRFTAFWPFLVAGELGEIFEKLINESHPKRLIMNPCDCILFSGKGLYFWVLHSQQALDKKKFPCRPVSTLEQWSSSYVQRSGCLQKGWTRRRQLWNITFAVVIPRALNCYVYIKRL